MKRAFSIILILSLAVFFATGAALADSGLTDNETASGCWKWIAPPGWAGPPGSWEPGPN